MERALFIHSPRIMKIEVIRHGKVRRAKPYSLRNPRDKAARIKERRGSPAAQQRRGLAGEVGR